MTSAVDRIARSSMVVAAAVTLAACGPGALDHGIVKDKRGHAGYTTTTYRNVYSETNCRIITASALKLSFAAKPRPVGGTGGSSKGGKTTTPDLKKNDSKTGTGGTRRVCDRTVTGREPYPQYHPPVWELKLKDGSRTGWKRVSKEVWDDTEVGDRI